MDFFKKPQRYFCVILAVIIIFAVNAPVFLQKTGALLPVIDEEEPSEEVPVDPSTDPVEPPTDPVDPPTDPVDPPTDPVDPPTDPVDPPTDPVDPPTDPVDPPTDPVDPPTDPVDPPTRYTPPYTTPQYTTPSRNNTPSRASTAPAVPETTTSPDFVPSIIEKYEAVQEFLTDTQLDDQNIASTEKDQNAVHIGGGNVIVNNSNISRINKASTVGENSSHYGVGSVILATNGTGFISKTTVNSEAKSATGAFAYGNAKLYMADTNISTALDNAYGLETAETGKLYAWNMTVQTLGADSSPVYTGPGGGVIVLDGGSYSSSGLRSPAVHCVGDVSLSNGEFSAEQSEAAVVENGNTLTLCDANLTGSLRVSEDHPFQWTVLLYQPGQKDTALQTNYYMKGGSLTSKAGGLFYVTNTNSNIYLENVAIKPFKNSDFLVRCTANSDKVMWGSPMKNGATCNLTAVNQPLEGNVVWDALSEVSLYVKDGSSFTGAFVKDEAVKTGSGFADLYLGEGCTWTVAGDSVLSHFHNAGTIADTSGNPVTIKKTDGTVIAEGTSAYTIVVMSYEQGANMAGAQKAPDWSKAAVARPAALGASLAEITTEETTVESTTPAEPDAVYEGRKAIAKYVLIGVGVVAVGAAVFWIYQTNKYKLKKLLRGQK